MLQYLINTNESDAMSELRNIASKLTSFVALSLGDHKKKANVSVTTTDICRKVLDWTKSYDKEPTMCVYTNSNNFLLKN